jgi:hypothetical protein
MLKDTQRSMWKDTQHSMWKDTQRSMWKHELEKMNNLTIAIFRTKSFVNNLLFFRI